MYYLYAFQCACHRNTSPHNVKSVHRGTIYQTSPCELTVFPKRRLKIDMDIIKSFFRKKKMFSWEAFLRK